MALSPEHAREFVTAGANWLDKHEPGWLPKINEKELRISSCENCVGGQLRGHYFAFKDYHRLGQPEAASLGFTAPDNAIFPIIWCNVLTTAWKSLIAERRSQA
jgi:hypothetical protein